MRWEDGKHAVVDAGTDLNHESCLFKDLPGKAFFLRLACFGPAARQFPLISVVAQKKYFGRSVDLAEQNSFDRYGRFDLIRDKHILQTYGKDGLHESSEPVEKRRSGAKAPGFMRLLRHPSTSLRAG